jgi:putative phage-type endonuclease
MIQGSDEWIKARLGKVTASRIGDLMAKTKTGYSTSRKNYLAELVVERETGEPYPTYTNAIMQRGLEIEPEARMAYCFEMNVEVEQVGFIPHPTIAMAGASPDGLVNADGLVEFKCPNSVQHLDALLHPSAIDSKYLLQMQFQMAVTGRSFCHFVSYDPRVKRRPLAIARVPRDDKLIAEIEKEVRVFLSEVDATITALEKAHPLLVAV